METSDFLSEEFEHSLNSLDELFVLRQRLKTIDVDLCANEELQPLDATEDFLRAPLRQRPALEVVGQFTDHAEEVIRDIEDCVRSIGITLGDNWEPLRRSVEVPFDHSQEPTWSLGAVTLRVTRRPFLRGYVDLVERRPIAPRLSKSLFALFKSVPGTRDTLTREGGQWGYHYHYCDDKKRRSDTLLTFDHRLGGLPQPKLCWEHHAENKSEFKARAGTWGVAKRTSVYGVCLQYPASWPLSAFKTPSKDALAVWPI